MPGHRNWRDPLGSVLPPAAFKAARDGCDLRFTVWLHGFSVAREREFFWLLSLIYSTDPLVYRRRGKQRLVRLPLAKPYSFAGVRVLTRTYNVPWEAYESTDLRR